MADAPLGVDQGATGVALMLAKLRTRASLLMIVAHPDDEDGGMLTYESRGRGARVGMLTLTRGEGGQNVMSGDFNDALGLLRTRELLAADRYMGVDQMFGTEVDFGFSKTKEEAFSQWTHQRVLYDAVRAVRLYRPLVVTSVFVGGPTDGHGQHQVSGEIAQEVFTAAADPKVFPEMGLPAWAPAKVYARVPFAQVNGRGMFDYATGKWVPARFFNYVRQQWSTEAPSANVTVPEGEDSSLLGRSYVAFARQGLALQRTQIGGGMRLAPAGRYDVGYTRYGSRVDSGPEEKDFFAGVDVTLAGIATLAPSLGGTGWLRKALMEVEQSVEEADRRYQAAKPESVAPALRVGLTRVRALIARTESERGLPRDERANVLHELRVKEVQFNQALVMALGLTLEAEASEATEVVPGQTFGVKIRLGAASQATLQISRAMLRPTAGPTGGAAIDLLRGVAPALAKTDGVLLDRSVRFGFAEGSPVTRPPYRRANLEQPFYNVEVAALRGAPTAPAPLAVEATVLYEGTAIQLSRVVGSTVGPEENRAYQPVTVVPRISVALTPAAGVVPLRQSHFTLTARVTRSQGEAAVAQVRLETPAGWRAEKTGTVAAATGTVASTWGVRPAELGQHSYTLGAVATERGREYREGYVLTGYPGVTHDALYTPAASRVRGIAVAVPEGLRVAYLPGTGDAVESTFAEIGVAATRVSVADMQAGRLGSFDALVMGVRAYAAHKDLPAATARLEEFARAGGVVVVQYNSGEFRAADAPYPLALGSAEKVVEERAPVRLLAPQTQALRWPNRLTERDFDGWVEERGHGFMDTWAKQFEAPTEVHDDGQDPQRGGLLIAPVGKGAYVYCAYALYRQLPEGVPGAFRLLANLISLGRHP